jgi:hypothetical protein
MKNSNTLPTDLLADAPPSGSLGLTDESGRSRSVDLGVEKEKANQAERLRPIPKRSGAEAGSQARRSPLMNGPAFGDLPPWLEDTPISSRPPYVGRSFSCEAEFWEADLIGLANESGKSNGWDVDAMINELLELTGPTGNPKYRAPNLNLRDRLDSIQRTVNTARTPLGVRADKVAPRNVRWFWPERIPRGYMTLLVGDTGSGKTTLIVDLAMRASRGLAFPDGKECAPGATILLASEDGAEDIIKPRLMAARADASQIVIVPAFYRDEKMHVITLSDIDLARIEDAAQRSRASLIVIDPFEGFLGGGDYNPNSNAEIRVVLAKLQDLAARTGTAVMLVSHPNKRSGEKALYRASGSVAILAACRAGYGIGPDPSDRDHRIFAPLKPPNMAEMPSSIAFSFDPVEISTEDGCAKMARVRWGGEVDASADDIFAAPTAKPPSKLDEAKNFLLDFLGDGEKSFEEVERASRGRRIAPKTLHDARKELGIRPGHGIRKIGLSGKSVWYLPA